MLTNYQKEAIKMFIREGTRAKQQAQFTKNNQRS